jgi:hypothetical protein
MGLIVHSMQAVIGITGRIQGRSHVMRITIAGIRIRISVLVFSQIQEILTITRGNSWLNSSTLSKGKIHNGGNNQLVPNRENWLF